MTKPKQMFIALQKYLNNYRFLTSTNNDGDRFALDAKRALEGDILAFEYGNVRFDRIRQKLDRFWFAGN